jgi:anti-anti-sigma regulatory factor
MPTQITQLDDNERGCSVLRVEGQLLRDDAELLCKIARQVAENIDRPVAIDLADVDFIDSEAATVLRRLQSIDGFELTGVEILLQNAVNEVERHEQ